MTSKAPSKLPRPTLVKNDRHADVYFKMQQSNCLAMVGDVTIAHPFKGASRDPAEWGERVANKLRDTSAAKDATYYAYHTAQGYLFVPFAATTFGQLDPHSLRLLWYLTDCAARKYYERMGFQVVGDKGPTPGYLRHRARVFLRHKSRVAMAVSRAGARRAMVWGDDRGRVNIRVRAPNDALQKHNEHLPVGGGDLRSVDHRLLVDMADAAYGG